MPGLPAYREVHLRLFAGAPPGRSAELARDLATVLSRWGAVTVDAHGPYWRIPSDLEFSVRLEPAGQVASCVRELLAGGGPGWQVDEDGSADGFYEAYWNQEPGAVLLHPAVSSVHLVSAQAPRPPEHREREIVRVRADGRLLWVKGSAVDRDGNWGYFLQMLDEDIDPEEVMPKIVEYVNEDELEQTGRFVPEDDEPPRFVAIDRVGRITGSSF